MSLTFSFEPFDPQRRPGAPASAAPVATGGVPGVFLLETKEEQASLCERPVVAVQDPLARRKPGEKNRSARILICALACVALLAVLATAIPVGADAVDTITTFRGSGTSVVFKLSLIHI